LNGGGERLGPFCLVGFGGHARTKLIPAIAANGQTVAGLVSRKAAGDLPQAPVFRDLDDALSALPPETVFLLSSPPLAHFLQANRLLEAERDVIVEKPAFVRADDARAAADLAQRRGVLLIEAFMHRHSKLYARFMETWRSRRDEIAALDIVFLIPELPSGTFRGDADVGSSALFDVGCYATSLMADLALRLESLRLTLAECSAGPLRESYELSGELNAVPVRVTLGVGAPYANEVALRFHGGDSLTFSPFFYGRPGRRSLAAVTGGACSSEEIIETDAFEAMLAIPPTEWWRTQTDRMSRLIAATACLERLGEQLVEARRGKTGV
jgi:hypothetical protein